ncbi:nucleoside triphosphate pyrophosphohydrolase [Mergibacter septicus]|uniref:nucleoside triphosphate pyrophosphohydrolase n=1 Tax=Mergibacter septicus TaxID=221402 RepID=UPI001178EBBC|nr:nucleoside triphosphate pyrophosphohydrolase [Mergibacter septicus]AWX14475.1 nucleoside triphosphate pyrophosphohydrolase [Mergibacter septicus]
MNKIDRMQKFIKIIARLRDPKNGCPWDLEQSFETMSPYVLEEAYEVVEALEQNDPINLKEELGDLLLQVVFLSQLASEANLFTIDEVVESVSEKIVRRHPHVFGKVKADTSEQVLQNWEQIKQQERQEKAQYSVLDNIPLALPALVRAEKVQKRCAKVGFDWDSVSPVVEKIQEELDEVRQELIREPQNQQAIAEEVGDLLFAMVNLSRHLDLPAEHLLRKATQKFERRFKKVEQEVKQQQKTFEMMNLVELDLIWDQVKREEQE